MPDRVQISDASLAAVQSPRRVELLVLLEQGAWTSAELADELRTTRQTVMHHVRALSNAGLVHVVSEEGGHAGGPLRSYGAVRSGWAEAIAALNALSVSPED